MGGERFLESASNPSTTLSTWTRFNGGLSEIDESENSSWDREVKNAGRLTLRSARGRRFEAHTLFAIDCSWANETSKLTAHYEFKRRNNRSRPDACPSCPVLFVTLSLFHRVASIYRGYIFPPPLAPLNSGFWKRGEKRTGIASRSRFTFAMLRRWTGRGSQGTGGFSNVEKCYCKWLVQIATRELLIGKLFLFPFLDAELK